MPIVSLLLLAKGNLFSEITPNPLWLMDIKAYLLIRIGPSLFGYIQMIQMPPFWIGDRMVPEKLGVFELIEGKLSLNFGGGVILSTQQTINDSAWHNVVVTF